MTRQLINNHIQETVNKYPTARLVENKYKVITHTILYKYPILKDISKASLEAIIDDAIHLDRHWRKITEGDDIENKKEAEKKWLLENGYRAKEIV